jgi:predicted nucleic acid-binding protein
VAEPGTPSVDHVFARAREKRQVGIVFSAWNIGELLGTLDRRHEQNRLSDAEFSSAIQNFSDETLEMTQLGSMRIMPITGKLLTASWRIIAKEHIYQADALQIASCKDEACDILLSADHHLLGAAKKQKINGLDPEKDEKKLTTL